MAKFVNPSDRTWGSTPVVGLDMERCVLWDGRWNVFTGFYRMPRGMRLPLHRHALWVQVLVMEGRMKVDTGAAGTRTIDAGGYYFVEPGDAHVETALEDTVVFVVSQVEDGRQSNVVPP